MTFGYADIDARRPIRPAERFHIGSITKSFAALMIMQLVDEGKVALDADVTHYLPELQLRTPFGAVSVHNLLTHTSGLQSEPPAIGWPDQVVEQTFAPGSRFHYCNMGYEWLGRIIVSRGGEGWGRALHRRILDPLGMSQTSTMIGAGMRRLEVPSYFRRDDDRPFPRRGALTRAAPLTFTAASGCIASTAADMNKYIAMICRAGVGPHGRLVSPEGFALMVKQQIRATEFGPRGGYGYGWMIDDVDGRPVIRHTGGMESFMSSIHIDLAAGCGAFASINAQQNYRPVPITKQALRLCRARAAGKAAPSAPSIDPDADLNPTDYIGAYIGHDGSVARVAAAGLTLTVTIGGRALALESLGDDKFVSLDPAFRLFTFLFRREKSLAEATPDQPNSVVALEWGRDSYIRAGAVQPPPAVLDRVTLKQTQLSDYEGLYRSDGGWLTAVRVVAREGRLWVDSFDGMIPLAALGNDRFQFADETANPEVALFSSAQQQPRTLSIAGSAMVRVGDPFMEVR